MKPEFLAPHSIRLLAGTLLPGALSISPFCFLAFSRFTWISSVLYNYPWAIVVLLLGASYLAGMILGSFGCAIEEFLIDNFTKNKKQMMDAWYEYLKSGINTESPGKKYVGTAVTWLKFYTSMIACIVVFLIGFTVHQVYWKSLNKFEFYSAFFFVTTLLPWFTWQSKCMIEELNKLRVNLFLVESDDE